MKNPSHNPTLSDAAIFPSWYVYYKVENQDVREVQNLIHPILVAAKVYCQHVKLLRRPSAPADPVTFLEVYQNISNEAELASLLERLLLQSRLSSFLISPRHKEVFFDLD